MAALPSEAELWAWTERLNSFGPRLTGTPAHQQSIDYIAAELQAMGLKVERDRRTMRRWTPRDCALTLASGAAVTVSAPIPYSGCTSKAGVSGKLRWFDKLPLVYPSMKGEIAVVRVKRRDVSKWLAKSVWNIEAALPDDASADIHAKETTPLITGMIGIRHAWAKRAGAAGVVAVFDGVSPANLNGQVVPFIEPYADCPALWVCAKDAADLERAAKQGEQANLRLVADLEEGVTTDTLWSVLPGSDQAEAVIINTHSDGPNACEENGPAALLALARFFSQKPQSERRRTLIFVFATGHFQLPQLGMGGQATTAWLQMHRELWDGKAGHPKAVAGLTIEHLGCLEWKDDLTHEPRPTGKLERDIVYGTNRTMRQLYRDAVVGRMKLRTLLVSPRISCVMLGEGQPLHDHGIPSVSNCPLPDYLCQELLPEDGLKRLCPQYMYEQLETFHRILLALETLKAREIGGISFNLARVIRRLGIHPH